MEVKKIGALSEEERELLAKAGGFLGSLSKAFESGELDKIIDEDIELVSAILDVAQRVVGRSQN